MPQCCSGKSRITLGLYKLTLFRARCFCSSNGNRRVSSPNLVILLVSALMLSACSMKSFESFARANEKQADNINYNLSTGSGLQSPILVPDHIIKGAKKNLQGVGGHFARLIIGSGNDVRFKRPVAVHGRGDYLFIVDATERTVFKYNLKTKTIEPIADVGAQFIGAPGNIYVAKDMSFFVVDSEGKQVFHFSAEGDVLNIYSDPANLSRPLDVLVNEATGEIFVADGSYSHIIVFNKFGDTLRRVGKRGPQNSRVPGTFRAITDMAMGKDGLYVLDRLVLPIQVLPPEGGFIYSFGETEQVFPTAITVSEDEYVFVSDKSDNIIRVYKQGDLLAKVGGGGSGPGRFRIITGLWAHEGYLYVADSLNRRIQVLRIVGEPEIEATPSVN